MTEYESVTIFSPLPVLEAVSLPASTTCRGLQL